MDARAVALGWSNMLAACMIAGLLACAPTPERPPLPPLPTGIEAFDATVREQFEHNHATLEGLLDADCCIRDEQIGSALGEYGMLLEAYGQHEAARVAYAGAARLDSDQPNWAYLLGRRQHAAGQIDSALSLLQDLVEGRPDWLPALRLLSEIHLEWGNGTEAQVLADRIAEVDPEDLGGRSLQARILLQQDDFEGALAELTELLEVQPGANDVLHLAAAAARQLDRLDEAEGLLAATHNEYLGRRDLLVTNELDERIQALRQGTMAYDQQGQRQLRRRDLAGAARSFERALEINPDMHETRFNLGLARLRLGGTAAARAQAEWLTREVPDFASGHLLMAEVLLSEGSDCLAVAPLRHALEADAGHTGAERRLAEIETSGKCQ